MAIFCGAAKNSLRGTGVFIYIWSMRWMLLLWISFIMHHIEVSPAQWGGIFLFLFYFKWFGSVPPQNLITPL
jgi:hypothetical protein